MKKHKIKHIKNTRLVPIYFSPQSAETIRRIAAERGVAIYQLGDDIVSDWVNWKEPTYSINIKNLIDKAQSV